MAAVLSKSKLTTFLNCILAKIFIWKAECTELSCDNKCKCFFSSKFVSTFQKSDEDNIVQNWLQCKTMLNFFVKVYFWMIRSITEVFYVRSNKSFYFV